MSDQFPDRLSVNPSSPYYDADVLTRGVEHPPGNGFAIGYASDLH